MTGAGQHAEGQPPKCTKGICFDAGQHAESQYHNSTQSSMHHSFSPAHKLALPVTKHYWISMPQYLHAAPWTHSGLLLGIPVGSHARAMLPWVVQMIIKAASIIKKHAGCERNAGHCAPGGGN
jgi:hypothetical protein